MTAPARECQPDITSLPERLRHQVGDDHAHGCMGRQDSCDCGYDLSTEGLLEMAADRIEELTKALEFYAGNCTDDGRRARAAISLEDRK